MLHLIEQYIHNHQLVTNRQQPVVVALSGGRDSVVLLDILVKLGYKCIVAHCNFHLRGKDSIRDQQFAEKLAHHLKLPFQTINFNTIEFAKDKGISIEMAARELRYDWLETVRNDFNAQSIAVGHHSDDNAETLLLNLIRGTGIRGLTGMQARNGFIIRPLLTASRADIDLYIEEHGLDFTEDNTNASTDFVRNKIRHEIIPQMATINPSVLQSINDTAGYLSGVLNIFVNAKDQIIASIVKKKDKRIFIDINQLKLQQEIPTILFEFLHPYGFNSSQIMQIAASLSTMGGKVFYSATHQLLKDRNHYILASITDTEHLNANPPDNELIIKVKDEHFVWSKDPSCIHLDADKVALPLRWRLWQPGDSFYPLGMKGRKKISDFLIDQKINRIDKSSVWVVEAADGNIIWLAGHRMDERYKIDASTVNILELKLIRKGNINTEK